ncbi:MAG: hypothetical protein ACRDTG_11985 [Pseudonocardiaceae bacterium]
MSSQPPHPPRPENVCLADALEGLRDLDELPVVEHVARFNAVHESLTAALSTIDEV